MSGHGYRFDPRARRWRDGSGRFVRTRRGRRRSDRLQRGLELVALGHVVPGREGCTVVSANGAHFYRVSLDGCDCPDAHYRGSVCKHRLALAVAARRLGALMRSVEQ